MTTFLNQTGSLRSIIDFGRLLRAVALGLVPASRATLLNESGSLRSFMGFSLFFVAAPAAAGFTLGSASASTWRKRSPADPGEHADVCQTTGRSRRGAGLRCRCSPHRADRIPTRALRNRRPAPDGDRDSPR